MRNEESQIITTRRITVVSTTRSSLTLHRTMISVWPTRDNAEVREHGSIIVFSSNQLDSYRVLGKEA